MSIFVDYLHDVLRSFGPISSRKMFGGYGIYHDGVMFGLVADEILYFKTDEETSLLYRERDLPPFEYEKGSKKVKMSYHRVPEEIFDDEAEAEIWARRAYDCAVAAKAKRNR